MNLPQDILLKYNLSTLTCQRCNDTFNIYELFQRKYAELHSNRYDINRRCTCQYINLHDFKSKLVNGLSISKRVDIDSVMYDIHVIFYVSSNKSVSSVFLCKNNARYGLVYSPICAFDYVAFSNLNCNDTTINELETILIMQ